MAAPGAEPDKLMHTLDSDVVTNVKVSQRDDTVFAPTIFEDGGEVRLHIALKDAGTPTAPTEPQPTT